MRNRPSETEPIAVLDSKDDENGATAATSASRSSLANSVGRYGVIVAFILTVVLFAILKGHAFLQIGNFKVLLEQSAAPAVLAFGLTIVLAVNDFDLSFGSVLSLVGATSIVLMSMHHVNVILAIAAGLLVGCIIGLINGIAVAGAKASSFIITLATGTVCTGIEYLITGQNSIYNGISSGYLAIGNNEFFGYNVEIFIAIGVFLLVYLLLNQTETGRRMYAAGSNVEAARLSGVRTSRIRITAFVLMGLIAAIGGTMIMAQNGAYTPSVGASYLLPAYAAAFLGTSISRHGLFTVGGTAIGVLYLGILQNGLILLGLSDPWVNVFQGAILAGAVLLARVGSGRR
jgi:ribose transport system permease protein